MAYIVDDDADDVPTIWHEVAMMQAKPVLTANDIRPGFRRDVWPKIVSALTVDQANRSISDTEAVDRIAEILSADEWKVDFLEFIGEIVRAAGRCIDKQAEPC
jgi:hypothetical protein